MNFESLFISLDSSEICNFLSRAEIAACYAAPGIQPEVADALASLAQRLGPQLITVYIDFDERVLRMGYGDLKAVETLHAAGIYVNSSPGLRTSLVIVDGEGYIFTPTALLLESERSSAASFNAMRMSHNQSQEALARLSPAAKEIAILFAATENEKSLIEDQAVELPSSIVTNHELQAVKKRLEEAPPIEFDIARQVRVYNCYIQYVELKLSGAAIQRHRITIPKSIHKLGNSKDIEARLKTTFELIEKDGLFSSKKLEEDLNGIRNNLTPSLGKKHGRAILKQNKPLLEKRLGEFRNNLENHQAAVEKGLQRKLDESRDQIVEHFLPLVLECPPDQLLGQCVDVTKDTARNWLLRELSKVLPTAEQLTEKMNLEVNYKDVTFETLKEEGFLKAVENTFPGVNWRIPYDEYMAAGEANKL